MPDFKRDKVIPIQTFHIDTEACGTLHLTIGKQEDKIIEVRGTIGKAGTCCNTFLNSFCLITSILLQGDMPRYKIIEKFKNQFIETNCGQPFIWRDKKYTSCVDLISCVVNAELERQV